MAAVKLTVTEGICSAPVTVATGLAEVGVTVTPLLRLMAAVVLGICTTVLPLAGGGGGGGRVGVMVAVAPAA